MGENGDWIFLTAATETRTNAFSSFLLLLRPRPPSRKAQSAPEIHHLAGSRAWIHIYVSVITRLRQIYVRAAG